MNSILNTLDKNPKIIPRYFLARTIEKPRSTMAISH